MEAPLAKRKYNANASQVILIVFKFEFPLKSGTVGVLLDEYDNGSCH